MTTEPEPDPELKNLLAQVYHKGSTVARKLHRALYIKSLGRNDPCCCGSGVKVKKCCGKVPMDALIKSTSMQLAKMDRVLGFGTKEYLN